MSEDRLYTRAELERVAYEVRRICAMAEEANPAEPRGSMAATVNVDLTIERTLADTTRESA